MSNLTLGRLLGSGKEAEVFECGELVVKLYRATASKRSAFREARLANNIRQSVRLGEPLQKALLEGLAALPDGDRLCHGDFHPMNILGSPGREMVVDWLDATSGDPDADVCRSYVLIKPSNPELASSYLAAYSELSGGSQERILRWLPFVAAARLAEGVPDEVDALMGMAETFRAPANRRP